VGKNIDSFYDYIDIHQANNTISPIIKVKKCEVWPANVSSKPLGQEQR
jgi:hypothetical protein